jgi:hypothetical protein
MRLCVIAHQWIPLLNKLTMSFLEESVLLVALVVDLPLGICRQPRFRLLTRLLINQQ